MERFTQDSFRVITKEIDYDNTYDLSTFINTISDKYDVFLASDLEEIQDFMSVELGIVLEKHVSAGKPLVGICLGMQLLYDASYEGGYYLNT